MIPMSLSAPRETGTPPAFSKGRLAGASACQRAPDERRHRSAILRQRIEHPIARHGRSARKKLRQNGEGPCVGPRAFDGELHAGDTACAQSGTAYCVHATGGPSGVDRKASPIRLDFRFLAKTVRYGVRESTAFLLHPSAF